MANACPRHFIMLTSVRTGKSCWWACCSAPCLSPSASLPESSRITITFSRRPTGWFAPPAHPCPQTDQSRQRPQAERMELCADIAVVLTRLSGGNDDQMARYHGGEARKRSRSRLCGRLDHLRARHAGRNRHRLGVCDLTPQLAPFQGPLQTGVFSPPRKRMTARRLGKFHTPPGWTKQYTKPLRLKKTIPCPVGLLLSHLSLLFGISISVPI